MAEYIADKKYIFLHQKKDDFCIINADNKYIQDFEPEIGSQIIKFSSQKLEDGKSVYINADAIWTWDGTEEKKVMNIDEVKIKGAHNLENILAAVAAALVVGVKISAIKKVLHDFKGLPNRLEFLREVRGVKYYNDTTSTTPEATMAALKTLGQENKKIILIAGGADKGLDFKELVKETKKYCRGVIFLNGSGTDRLIEKYPIANIQYLIVNSMAEAVLAAKSAAKPEDIVLLSPACASFGLFKNEFDRGDQFIKLVKKIK